MKKIISVYLIIFALLSFDIELLANSENMYDDEELTEEEILEVINIKGEFNILAKSAILYDRTYKKILYEKNIDEKIPNASTTKILTAIVAYENSNLEEIVEVSKRAATIGGSTINLRTGSKITMGDLLKGLLICSGNDAAIAIAEHVAGSVENFCNMMNEKAKELGADSTNFVTPHGLDNENHYTTARDLIKFADYLLNIEKLAEIVNMKEATLRIDNYSRYIHATNEMLSIFEEASGIKTGYTSKAGRCLVTSIKRGNRELITIVLGCDTRKQRTSETVQLINYGYKNFKEVDIYQNVQKKFNITVHKAKADSYEVTIYGNKFTVLPVEESNVTYEYKISNELNAPIEKGTKIGEILIRSGGEAIDKIEIKLPVAIERKSTMEYFEEMLKNQKRYTQLNI